MDNLIKPGLSQKELTEQLNFDYYLVSSPREREIFSRETAFLEPAVYEQMLASANVLYQLVHRVITEYLSDPARHPGLFIPDFPYRQQIFALPVDLLPFFWVRYDAFERSSGGIFFSEFNYDKPCAQREILVSNAFNPEGNPNGQFAERFRSAMASLWAQYRKVCSLSPKARTGDCRPTIGLLVDPNHYEETHLAFLYADLLKPLGWQTLIVGGQNLQVKNDRVEAFGQPLDILLRQFPTEFSHEIQAYPAILRLFAQGKVLLLNDPRAIIPQAKSLFAYLWELYEHSSSSLSEAEKKTISETIPYTRLFDPDDLPALLADQEHWVVKSVYGRYSEEVYIGAMLHPKEWRAVLAEAARSGRAHIRQEFVPIKRKVRRRFVQSHYDNTIAYGNYGLYFTQGELAGLCVRWSSDYLTADETGWFSPVGVSKAAKPPFSRQTANWAAPERRARWKEIADQAAFTFDYPGSYTGELESFCLEPLIISNNTYQQIGAATEELAQLFVKAVRLVRDKIKTFGPLLGIPDQLTELVRQDKTDWLTFLGRFDWVFNRQGQLKLLEINTDTPAGLECCGLNHLVHCSWPIGKNPNQKLPQLLAEKFNEFISGSRSLVDGELTVGLVTCVACEEDWFNLQQVRAALRHLPYKYIIGDINGLAGKDNRLYLTGQAVEVLYRYYPLDWLAEDEHWQSLHPALKSIPVLNPPSALIAQSKAFQALVWQLAEQGYYSTAEQKLIRRYLVPSYLDYPGRPCVIKPYLGREGQGILFSAQLSQLQLRKLAEQDLVYQETVDIWPVDLTLHTPYKSWAEVAYPIIGAYLIGDQFGGLYTRLGGRVTNRYAVVCPTFVL